VKHGDVLRPATLDELETLLPFVRGFYEHFAYPFSEVEKRGTLERVLRDPALGRLFFIASPAADPFGYVFLSFYFSIEYGGLTAFIDEIYIAPGKRSEGLGSAALSSILGLAPALGLSAVHLEVERANTRAAELYARLGFVDYGRRLLTRRLPPPR
jgi:ribosomal protein S18 acetylase RimI-like enzyme